MNFEIAVRLQLLYKEGFHVFFCIKNISISYLFAIVFIKRKKIASRKTDDQALIHREVHMQKGYLTVAFSFSRTSFCYLEMQYSCFILLLTFFLYKIIQKQIF
jgi:hypothetical protein